MSVARATFIEYLDGIGMGLEIRAYPKNSKGTAKAETLLKLSVCLRG